VCTLSFLPTVEGFRLAMNRDEKRARVAALPPKKFQLGQRQALYPHEPGGGTWLAVNDAGLCLALINWHRVKREPRAKTESRGQVIPRLIGLPSTKVLGRNLRALPLPNLRPFRLIAIDGKLRRLTEWRWDTKSLASRQFDWRTRHWFSSGYDELTAEKVRTPICDLWPLGTAAQLRKLHASHLPERGPFSICMHRADAVTVSYSEVIVSERRVTFRYLPGSPCKSRDANARTGRGIAKALTSILSRSRCLAPKAPDHF
jgi:hypothetical protein